MKLKTLEKNTKEFLKKHKYIIFSILICLLMLSPLYSDHYYRGHDAKYHVSVVSAYSKCIHLSKAQIFLPDILPEIARNFGYGTGIFYPQLPHLVATFLYKLFSVFNITVPDALKITTIIAAVASAVFIYQLSLKINKNKKIALISSIIFMVMPYRLSEIYVRDAFAENFTFIFMPMILLGLYELIDKNYKRFYLFFTIGYVGMIYSHLVMTMFFTIFLVPFFVIYYKEIFTKENIVKLCISTGIILIIVSTFIIPMLYHKINGHYVVFEDKEMAGIEKVEKNQLQLSDFFKVTGIAKNQENTLEKITPIQYYIPMTVVVFMGLTLYYFNKNDNNKKAIFFMGLETVLAMFMASKQCPWDKLPNFLYMIQFPWRMETILTVALSIIAPVWLLHYRKEDYFTILCIVLGIILLTFGITNINYRDNININAKKINTEDVSKYGMGNQQEYLPVNAKKETDYYKNRNHEVIQLNSNDAQIKKLYSHVPKLIFEAKNVSRKTTVELPRLFYFGYELHNVTTNQQIELYESDNGFLAADIDCDGQYVLEYKGLHMLKILRTLQILLALWLICMMMIKRHAHIMRRKRPSEKWRREQNQHSTNKEYTLN